MGAATAQGNAEASKSVMRRVALQPRRTCVQNRSRPTPYGDTTPMPLIATRSTMPPIIPRGCAILGWMAQRRLAALVWIWCACAAPAPLIAPVGPPARLPDALVRAVERMSPGDIRGYVEVLASDRLA